MTWHSYITNATVCSRVNEFKATAHISTILTTTIPFDVLTDSVSQEASRSGEPLDQDLRTCDPGKPTPISMPRTNILTHVTQPAIVTTILPPPAPTPVPVTTTAPVPAPAPAPIPAPPAPVPAPAPVPKPSTSVPPVSNLIPFPASRWEP